MKKLIFIVLLVVGWVFAEQYEDVVILKNGSEIHGIIIEEKPYEYIKIQSGKNTFVLQFDEIELLKAHILYLEKKDYSVTSVSSGEDGVVVLSLFIEPLIAGQTTALPLLIIKSSPNSPILASSISGGVI